MCCSPDPPVRAGQHHFDTRSLTLGALGRGHECIPFVTASSSVVRFQVLTVLCIFFFLSPSPFPLISLSSSSCSFHFLWLSVSSLHFHLGLYVALFYLPHSLHLFPPSLWPPPFLHRSIVLFLSFPLATAAGPAPFPACCPGAAYGPSPLWPASPGTGSGRRLWAAGPVRGP